MGILGFRATGHTTWTSLLRDKVKMIKSDPSVWLSGAWPSVLCCTKFYIGFEFIKVKENLIKILQSITVALYISSAACHSQVSTLFPLVCALRPAHIT